MLDEPPFTNVDKIRTDPESDARAGVSARHTPAAVTAAAPATTTVTGVSPDAASDDAVTTAPSRRTRCATPRRRAGLWPSARVRGLILLREKSDAPTHPTRPLSIPKLEQLGAPKKIAHSDDMLNERSKGYVTRMMNEQVEYIKNQIVSKSLPSAIMADQSLEMAIGF